MALAAVPLSHDQARPRLGCLGELRLLLPVLLRFCGQVLLQRRDHRLGLGHLPRISPAAAAAAGRRLLRLLLRLLRLLLRLLRRHLLRLCGGGGDLLLRRLLGLGPGLGPGLGAKGQGLAKGLP